MSRNVYKILLILEYKSLYYSHDQGTDTERRTASNRSKRSRHRSIQSWQSCLAIHCCKLYHYRFIFYYYSTMTTQSQIRDRVNPMLFANQTSLIDYIKDFLQANGDRNIENISREYENSEVMERWLVDSRLCKQLADR